MNKNYFTELAGFNLWANNIACNWLADITEEQWTMEIVSSFNSIRETVLHTVSAEKAWLERFRKNKEIVWLQSGFTGSKDELIAIWKNTSQELKQFINEFEETQLTVQLQFTRLNGEVYTMPYYQLFAHVVNHATYHRGQLVTMLRQAGYTKVQSTDLLGFYRQ